MIERSHSTMTIYSPAGVALATVSIEQTSLRKFTLMQEDYVQLDFSLAEAVFFPIGSYIVDPLFGRFAVLEEQMPAYKSATASYRYSLKLEAAYREWKNRLFMLTTTLSGTRSRKEAVWTLTGALSAHADEVLNNLAVLGWTGWSVTIEESCDKANEVRCLTYSGTNILDAMQQMADEWETEWWVSGTSIHFGKCEDTEAEEMTFELDDNVAEMTVQDNRKTYSDKVYVYGSDKNLPFSYRRVLSATVTEVTSSYEYGQMATLNKKLTPDYLVNFRDLEYAANLTLLNLPTWLPSTRTTSGVTILGSRVYADKTTYKVKMPDVYLMLDDDVPYTPRVTNPSVTGQSLTLSLVLKGVDSGLGTTIATAVMDDWSLMGNNKMYHRPVAFTQTATRVDVPEAEELVLQCIWTFTAPDLTPTAGSLLFGKDDGTSQYIHVVPTESETERMFNFTFEPDYQYVTAEVPCTIAGVSATATFRKDGKVTFKTTALPISSITPVVGDTVVLDTKSIYIPSAYYSTPYDDPSSLTSIGANRLRMPLATGDYLLPAGESGDGHRVESVVVFEDIYPDGKLYAEEVKAEEKKDYTKYDGEDETSDWQWHEYTLTPYLVSSQQRFWFRKEYMLQNVELQVRFLTPQDVGDTTPGDGYKLAGMTFGVQFNAKDSTFTIVRNSDFGALLPNDTLKPTRNDPFVLIGWNVYAVSELGLVADAERRLEAKGQEYMAAQEESQFTFTCTMYHDWMFTLGEGIHPYLVTSDGEQVVDSDGKAVRTGDRVFICPMEGQRVCIVNDALKQGAKHSRIIGYTLKLDKPYDAPQYVVGETEAYSRLAKIERQISNL